MKRFSNIDFCLVIPCYNNFDGLIDSLKSVIYQQDKFLVVIIDDGSKEAVTEERLGQALDNNKKPLVLLKNEKNLGITATLNKGLSWIEENVDTGLIARLDCGDICAPERFLLQVQYMNDHKEIGLTGSWCLFEDRKTLEKFSYKTPVLHEDILKAMHFRNVFIHPTVMFRKSLLNQIGYYPEGFELAEDYAFFWKMIKLQRSFVFDRFLVICEINKSGLSYKNKGKQLFARWRVVKTFGSNLALKITACIRLIFLFLLPKGLILQFKKWRP
jgi:glycosyltransferase involved in cell wall biosynthesis